MAARIRYRFANGAFEHSHIKDEMRKTQKQYAAESKAHAVNLEWYELLVCLQILSLDWVLFISAYLAVVAVILTAK